MFNRLLGRQSTTESTNDIVAAQERYQHWGTYLAQKIAEHQLLLGSAGAAEPASIAESSTSAVDTAKPLDVAAFTLVED